MESMVKTFSYPDGTMERVLLVRPESWDALNFLKLSYDESALDCFADIFRQYLVPACPWLFGNLVLFHIPMGLKIPFSHGTKYGCVSDDLTAAAAAMENGVPFEAVSRGLLNFRGAQRRFEYKGEINGARIYDDYAHHPVEIRATLAAAKKIGGRIICLFRRK